MKQHEEQDKIEETIVLRLKERQEFYPGKLDVAHSSYA